MDKKNLYKEEEASDDINEEEEEEEEEEDSNQNEEEEVEYEDEVVDELEESKALDLDDIMDNDNQLEKNPSIEDQIKTKLDLLDLDLASMTKDDLLHHLLQPEEPKVQKKKFPTQRGTSPNRSTIEINKNVKALTMNKDPEMSQDFNVALTKILSKMVKKNNGEIFDILISDRAKVEEELSKYNFTKHQGQKVEEKMKAWIEQKNKNLEILQERVDEEFNKNHTFTPQLINQSETKRNFNQFIEDQANHQKKLAEKLAMMQEEKDQQKFSVQQSVPKINETSKRLADKVTENEKSTKVYDRLYNKRNMVAKKELVKSASQLGSKSLNPVLSERTKILYDDAEKRKLRQQENEKKSLVPTGMKSSDNSNRVILKRFRSTFKEEVEKIFLQTNHNSPRLNFPQLNQLLINLNFFSDKGKDQEKKLIVELYESIKGQDNMINLDHLFLFCLAILNLFEYYIIKTYKKDTNYQPTDPSLQPCSSQRTLHSSASTKGVNEDANRQLAEIVNTELQNRIVQSVKYGGWDEENNYIITFSQAKLIFKDFNLFTSNWCSAASTKKKVEIPVVQHTFKPKINKNSQQLGNIYKHKVIEEVDAKDTLINQQNRNNFDQLHLMSYKKQQKEKMYEQMREEKEQNELEKCTFKPKINEYTTTRRPVENRFEAMYQKGTQQLMTKKDKTKEEMDVEKYGKECTFQPKITDQGLNGVFKEKEIPGKDDLIKYNERMQRGRMEKEYKESFLKRGINSTTTVSQETRNKSENKYRLLSPVNVRDKAFSPTRSTYMNNGLDKIYKGSNKDGEPKQINLNNDMRKFIIDVNVKPGEKKKIVVAQGDTAEMLASNFAKENNLDQPTRTKLQNLIQKEINKFFNF